MNTNSMKLETKSFLIGGAVSLSLLIRNCMSRGKDSIDLKDIIEVKEKLAAQISEHGMTPEQYDIYVAEALHKT